MIRKILALLFVLLGAGASGAYLLYYPAHATLSIMDPPPETYSSSITAITITFTKIEVHAANAGNDSGWHTLTTGGAVDLLSVLNAAQVLGTSNIPPGKYSEIRFFTSQAIITISGTDITYTIPSAQTGFKLVITGGGFQVMGGQSINVTLDLAFRNTEILNNPQRTLTPVATATVH